MRMRSTALFALALVLALGGPSGQDAPGQAARDRQVARTEGLRREIDALARGLGKRMARLETLRARCRRLERAQPARLGAHEKPAWPHAWRKTARLRREIEHRLERLLRAWEAKRGKLAGEEATGHREQLARSCLGVCSACLRIGEPGRVRALLDQNAASLASALAGLGDDKARRAFLGQVAARSAATPGQSDLDALCLVVAWEALLLEGKSTAARRVDLLTSDLVLIFTERRPDLFRRSGSALYQAGRFADRGFKETLRDGSDQVRHVCGALRVFFLVRDHDRAEELLRQKELRDARDRGEPLDEADLALNRVARAFLEEILGAPGETEPAAIASWAARLRRHLQGTGR